MKSIVKIPQKVKDEATKKILDGIIDVLVGMYERRTDEEKGMDFESFVLYIKTLTPEQLKERSINNDGNG